MVEKDFMDKFIETYKDAAYIQNNAIFIQKDIRSLNAQGKDLKESKLALMSTTDEK